MKVMMLGWEYPPMISGGLATASEGLTRAMAAQGVDIDFVLPRTTGREDARHMSILSCEELKRTEDPKSRVLAPPARESDKSWVVDSLFSAYARPRPATRQSGGEWKASLPQEWLSREPAEVMEELASCRTLEDPLFREVSRYARAVAQASKKRKFDLVHAHDWMTFPAGILLSRLAGVPLVLHVHSLEYDRCGDGGNPLIRAIETTGVHHADQVIAVSEYTRGILHDKLGVPEGKIAVARNGVKQVEEASATNSAPARRSSRSETRTLSRQDTKKRILFLGRVTYQKGPDTFVEAAAQVLMHFKDVTFVLAGSGDMLPRMRERVRELGIEDHFEFPGFVTGKRLEEEFSRADVYVMPSVSEPFGIAPLEALSYGTPAIISKQSGVSEVLSHVLKTDFWDVRKVADFILNVVLHPELGRSMMAMSPKEVKRLSWDHTATDVISTYQHVLPELGQDNQATRYREVM